MILDVNQLLTQNTGIMFNADTKFTIHNTAEPCSLLENTEEDVDEQEETTKSDANIEELLEGFPWRQKGIRLYRCMISQLNQEPPEPYVMIDLLKFCCTPVNRFSGSETNQRKLISLLKGFRAKGLKIPQAFLSRASVKKLF